MEMSLKELKQEIQDLKHQVKMLWIIFWLSIVLSIRLAILFIPSDIQDNPTLFLSLFMAMMFGSRVYVVNKKFYIKELKRKQLKYLYHSDPKAYSEQIKLSRK